MSKYPKTYSKRIIAKGYGGKIPYSCAKCKGEFTEGEEVRQATTEISYMRGDDEVEFFHLNCPKQ